MTLPITDSLLEDLIAAGLVEVRFDRRGSNLDPTAVAAGNTPAPAAGSTSAPSGTGFIGRDGDADGRRTIGSNDFAYVVECWEPVSGVCVVPMGESISSLKGANWKFGSTESALADAKSKGKPVYVVTDGELGPLAQ